MLIPASRLLLPAVVSPWAWRDPRPERRFEHICSLEASSKAPSHCWWMNLKNRSFTGLTATFKTHRNVLEIYPKFVPFSVIMTVTGWRLLSTNLNSSWVKDVQTSWSSAWVAVPFSRFPFKITSIHTYINICYDDIWIWIFFMFHHHLH